jgi:hypothetical protein
MRVLGFALLFAAVSGLSVFLYSEITGDEASAPGAFISEKIYSSVLKEEREVFIRLPRLYDPAKAYPVMYVLDGGSQDAHMANCLNVLTGAGYAPPTLVVGIPNNSKESRELNLTPPYMRRDNEDDQSEPGDGETFLRFIEQELIPFIEGKYATSGVRLLAGNSRGGLLVMHSLIFNPGLFHARFCFSAPFWRQDHILCSRVEEFLTGVDTLNTFMYLSAGENETDNIRSGLERMVSTLKNNTPVGLEVHSHLTPQATHQDNAVISSPDALARWSEYMAKPQQSVALPGLN